MTALKLDTRAPLIVIAGDFNPAIFTPFWVARFLHAKPEGTEVQSLEMLGDGPNGMVQMTFIDGVALVVSTARVEVLVLGQEPKRIEVVQRVLVNLAKVLPHTPIRGIGCNLQYADDDPSDPLLALFETQEGIEGDYVVRSRQFATQVEIENGVLNFNRAALGGVVQFGFNYHYATADNAAYVAAIDGLVGRSRDHSANFLSALYGLTEFETIGFIAVGDEENVGGEGAN